eukprot:RCo043579
MTESSESSSEDLYKVLKVTREASAPEIARAYKRLALLWHPDKNPHGEAEFKRLNAAFFVLGDAARRAEYDLRHAERGVSPVWVGSHSRRRQGESARGFAMAAAVEKDLDESLRREQSDLRQRSSWPISSDFGSWYRMKTKELEEVGEAARKQSEEKRQEQEQQLQEERKLSEVKAAQRRQRILAEQRQLAQQVVEEELRQQEARKLEQERLQKEAAERHAAEMARLAEAGERMETVLSDLKSRREDLNRERAKLAAEAAACREGLVERSPTVRAFRDQQLQEDQRAIDTRIDAIKRRAEQEKADQRQRERAARQLEELEAQREQELRQKLEEEAAENERQEQEWKEKRRKQLQELDARCKACMREIQESQKRHQEELEQMRRESAQAEANARAEVEALRCAQ